MATDRPEDVKLLVKWLEEQECISPAKGKMLVSLPIPLVATMR